MSLIPRMTQQEELRFGRGHSACGRGKRDEAPAPETMRPPPPYQGIKQKIKQYPWDSERG